MRRKNHFGDTIPLIPGEDQILNQMIEQCTCDVERQRLTQIRVKAKVSSMRHDYMNKVCLGSRPHLLVEDCKNIPPGECVAQVCGLEDDFCRGKIRYDGPLGTALLGKRPGDVVSYRGGRITVLKMLALNEEAPKLSSAVA